MQKEIKYPLLKQLARSLAITATILLLATAWIFMLLALQSLIKAIYVYNSSVINIALDAGVGYFGLLSFGLSSIALLFASSNLIKDRTKRFSFLYKTTFYAGMFLFISVILASAIYLMHKI